MDSTSADEDIQHTQYDRRVIGFKAAKQSFEDRSRNILSLNIDTDSSSQSVFSSDDTLTTSPIDDKEDKPHHRRLRFRPAIRTVNSSDTLVQTSGTHLFTHSWQIPTTYSIPDLCAYIEQTPTGHINLLKWCKDRTGVPHEFLLLQVENLQNKKMWLRIERRPQHTARLIFSTAPSDDTAKLSASHERLFSKSKNEVKVETEFTDPPSLKNLRSLLSILREESQMYKLWPENCWFFCSVIYESLFAMGRGMNTIGVPSEVAMSLAPKIRVKINRRVKDLFSNSSASRVEQCSDLMSGDSLVWMNTLPNTLQPESLSWEEPSALVKSLPRADHAAYDSGREDVPSSCLQGTRVAVLTEIMTWLESVDGSVPPIYWLNGLAGIGKSTIAMTVAERADEIGMLGGSFFFSRDDERLRDPSLVFPTLAFQLAHSDDTFMDVIGDALKHDSTIGHKELLQQLEGLILNPLLKIDRTKHTTLIILDALDECEETWAAEILRLLFSHATRIPFLRILITSRPERHISSVFDNAPNHAKTVLHDIEPSVVQEDIRRYMNVELRRIPKMLGLRMTATWATEEEMDSLVEKSGMLFFYAAACIRFIGDNRMRDPRSRLRLVLSTQTAQKAGATLYTPLNNLYMGVLRNSLSDSDPEVMAERFQVVVGSMVVLREHLPPISFAQFVRYETDIVQAILRRLGSVIHLPPNIHEAPRLYHPSFVDFITNASRCTMAKFVIAVPKQERRHALRCFELMATFLKRDMAGISDPSILNSEVDHFKDKVRKALPAEAQYACRHWVAHILHVEHGDAAVVEALEKFSKKLILWWLEAMSLLGSISTVAVSVSEVRRWAMRSGCTAVVTVLSDAHRFILAHAEIIGANALQVYYSALPFTPHNTALYKTYRHEVKQSITVLQGVESQWPLCLSALLGHSDSVNYVAFSPDGLRLASCSRDRTVRLWDALSSAHITTLEGHSDEVNSLAFSPDGLRLASCSDDRTARLWDPKSGVHIATLEGHSDKVNSLAFSPDGLRLVSCSDDHTARLWDAMSGAHIATLEGHSDKVKSLAFSPDGLRLASCSDDHTIRLWHAISGALIATLEGHSDRVRCVAFSPSGLQLASCSNDRTVRLWHAMSAAHIATLEGHSDEVNFLAFSPGGLRLASCSRDRTVRLWHAISGAHIAILKGHSGGVNSLAFSPDGLRIASCSYDRTVRLWDAISGTNIATLKGDSFWINSLVFSPDGLRLASCSHDDAVRLWDAMPGPHITTPRGHSGRVNSLAFSPDGLRLASCSDDHTVRLWHAMSGAHIATLKGHSDWVRSVTFSPDGVRLASCSDDLTVRLWDAMSSAHIATLQGHSDWVRSATFSPDGLRLASCSDDHTVRLWDTISGAQIATLEGHSQWVRSVAFSTDGLRLASCSDDREVWLWDAVSFTRIATLHRTDSTLFTDFSIYPGLPVVLTLVVGSIPLIQVVDRWIRIPLARDSQFERICQVPALYTLTTRVQVSGRRIVVGCADGRVLILSTEGLDF